MSGSINKAVILGNLTRDPEIRQTQNSRRLATMRVATNERWKQGGEQRERTEYHSVVIFSEGLVDIAEKYLRKGSKIYLEGQLQTRKWQDQSGADRYSTEVVLQGFGASLVMLDGKPDGQASPEPASAPAGGDDFSDDVPF